MQRYLLLFTLTAFVAYPAAETSHDAPLEIRNNTVHAKFRTDTLIDRRLAIAGNFATPEEILQHTHDFGHQIRIFVPNQPHMTLNLKPGDGLYFRLRGNRRLFGLLPGVVLGFLTVTQDETRDGVGGLVAGHAALTRGEPIQGHSHAHERYGPNVRTQAQALVAALPVADQKFANLVWVTKGPSGYKWTPENQDTDVTIGGKIVNSYTIRKQPKPDPKTIPVAEYLLRNKANRTDFNIDEFYIVPKGGSPQTSGICLPLGARVVICENISEDGVIKAFCPEQ